MDEQDFSIQPIRLWDLPTLTQMAFDNMTGVDREFTRFARSPLFRLFGYFVLPLYLFTAGRGYKAVHNGKILGCAYLHVRRRSGLVFNVNVNLPYRRQGVGRELMKHLEAEIRHARRHWLGLQVDRDNVPARKLYASLHYRPYHPYFLRTHARTITQQAALPGVSVHPLRRRDGHKSFTQYADLERREGDAWAAEVIKADFDEGPPLSGSYWLCYFGTREVGCAWIGGEARRPAILLLLEPEFWPRRTATIELLRALLDHTSPLPEFIDVHLGSSNHYEAAFPILEPFGFTQQEQARIMMLKEIRD